MKDITTKPTERTIINDFISHFSFSHKNTDAQMTEPAITKKRATSGILPTDMVITGSIDAECDLNIYGHITGNITSKGNINISGTVVGDVMGENITFCGATIEGKVTGRKMVTVEVNSVINGNIEAEGIDVSGTVNGNVIVNGQVNLTGISVITGDIEAMGISIANGAVVNGKIKINK